MKIIIETIPHEEQRYETIGDWMLNSEGDIKIHVSDMGEGKENYEFLIALHELLEAKLCSEHAISGKEVDEFDMKFELDRESGKHSLEEEPGDDPQAPYKDEHFFATSIERLVAQALGVDWKQYEDYLNNK